MQSEMEDDFHPWRLCPHEQVTQPVDLQSKAVAAENLILHDTSYRGGYPGVAVPVG